MIKLYIGSHTKPILLQEAVVANLSKVFASALRREDAFGGEQGVLKFPEDREDAWRMLVSWKIKGFLPKAYPPTTIEGMTMLLIHCWAMGDKYDIKEFQNEAMMRLIMHCEKNFPEQDEIKAVFDFTPEGSPLRRLMAEELDAFLAIIERESLDNMGSYPDLSYYDGCAGFISELRRAQIRRGRGLYVSRRLSIPEEVKTYMAGGLPKGYLWEYGVQVIARQGA